MNKINFWQKSIIVIVLCLMVFVVSAPRAQAQWTILASVPDVVKSVLDKVWQWAQVAILAGWKNGLNYFLSNLAKKEGARLAAGGRGQKTSFVDDIKGTFNEAVDSAAGDVLNTLAQGTLGVDLCALGNMDPSLSINLFLVLNQGTVTPKSACTLEKIRQSTKAFADRMMAKTHWNDWVKVNMEVRYATAGAGLVEADKELDDACKAVTGEAACNQGVTLPSSPDINRKCYWYIDECRSKLQARIQFCKNKTEYNENFTLKKSSTPAPANECLTKDRQAAASGEARYWNLHMYVTGLGECKWNDSTANFNNPLNPAVGQSMRDNSQLTKDEIKLYNASGGVDRLIENTSGGGTGTECIPDIGPLETLGDQFNNGLGSGGSELEAAVAVKNIMNQKEADARNGVSGQMSFGGMTLGGQGLISGFNTSPRELSQQQTGQLQTGMMNNLMADSGSALVNAGNVFLAALLPGLLQRWMKDLMPANDANNNKNIGFNRPGNASGSNGPPRNSSPAEEAVASFDQLVKPTLISSLQENLTDQLTTCQPNQDNTLRTKLGGYNCTINDKFVQALQGKTTVRQAVKEGFLSATDPLGFRANSPYTYTDSNPLSFRSLTILRSLQVIPVGWEIAALYAKNFANKDINLNYLALGTPLGATDSSYNSGCFEDVDHPNDPHYPAGCRVDTNNNGVTGLQDLNDLNPYWHLVDPDWVLKLPPTKCALGGSGEETFDVQFACTEDNVPNTQVKDDNGNAVGGVTQTPSCNPDAFLNPDLEVAIVTRKNDTCADRQDCIEFNTDGSCKSYGYCYEQKPNWHFDGQACSETAASCQSLTRNADGKAFNYLTKTLKTCDKPGCTWLATDKLGTSTWQLADDDNKIFLTLSGSSQKCSSQAAGCTRLVSQATGLNVVVDGNFSHNNWQDYWSTSTSNCFVGKSATEIDGQTPAGLVVKYNGNCLVKTKGDIPIVPTGIYLARVSAQAVATTTININFKMGATSYGALSLSIPAGSEAMTTSTIVFPNTAVINVKPEITINSTGATTTIKSFELVKVDSAQSQFANTYYNNDYSKATEFDAYYKVAPDNLHCDQFSNISYNETTAVACSDADKVWRADWNSCVAGGSTQCLAFAPFCKAEDVGCLGYQSVLGDPQISAKVTPVNYCPNACVGLNYFSRKSTVFEKQEGATEIFNQGAIFIPKTAKACQPQVAGCEEFTNLDNNNGGGESKEYYTFLRQCVQADNQQASYYYTWEGSDTAGFQLKRWQLLKSNQNLSPCSNIVPGAVSCSDPANPNSTTTNSGACGPENLVAGNFNCRDFFDVSNNHFYRLQDRTVSVSANCHPYRRTISGQVYNAIPTEGVRCQAADNGCREYLGNQGNSIRTIFTESFENPVAVPNNWSPANQLAISNISVQPGGHSLAMGQYIDITMSSSSLRIGRQYIITAWAKLVAGNAARMVDNMAIPNFALSNLTSTEWRLYSSQVVRIEQVADPNIIRIRILDLPNGYKPLIDNVTLQELPANFYVIENSWQTPNQCNPVQNYQGCQEYQVSAGGKVSLTGFAKVCSPQSMGCQAFIDTKNSEIQATTTYNSNLPAVNRVTVANDRLLYLVPQADKACSKADKACMAFGLPRQMDLADSLTGYGAETVYLKNDPDKYSQTLCSESQLFCSAFGESAYFDPAPIQAAVNTSKVCVWQDNAWKKADGTACPVNSDNRNYLLKSSQPGYDGWVGSCSAQDNSCTEYRDPEQPTTDQLPLCRSDIGKDTHNICDLGHPAQAGGEWCLNDGKKVCRVAQGATSCVYSNLWYCVSNPGEGAGGGDCNLDWYGNQIIPCQYSGVTTTFNGTVNYCQFDVSCKSYYYKKFDQEQSCGPKVYRSQGCRLFNDTSDPNLNWNATSSQDGQAPVSVAGTGLLPQANALIKIAPDRQCSEWLYCKTKFDITKGGQNDSLCLSLGACKKFNSDGACSEPVALSTSTMAINLNNSQGSANSSPWSKVTRYQTGYKYPDVIWSNNKKLSGNYLPALMNQATFGKDAIPDDQLTNNSFEKTASTTFSAIITEGSFNQGWYYRVSNSNAWRAGHISIPATCEFVRDSVGSDAEELSDALSLPLTSNYAMKTSLTSETSSYCQIGQGYQKDTTGHTGYTITFWAKAGKDGVQLRIGLGFSSNGVTDGWSPLASIFSLTTKWHKYTMVISADKVPPTANKFRFFVQAPFDVRQGEAWVDEILIQPSLQVGNDPSPRTWASAGQGYVAASCRVYPQKDSLSCSYRKSGKINEGLKGYCLETDPANGLCLKWYPLTYIAGSDSSMFTDETVAGFDNGKAPLYYCLQSENLLAREPIIELDNSTSTISERVNSRKNLISASRPFWLGNERLFNLIPAGLHFATHFTGVRKDEAAAEEAINCNTPNCNRAWNYLAYDFNGNYSIDEGDYMVNQPWPVVSSSDDNIYITDIDKIGFNLDWKSDNNWPNTIATTITAADLHTAYDAYYNEHRAYPHTQFRIIGDQGGWNGMWLGIRFLWNNQGLLTGYKLTGLANSQGDAIAFSPIFYLKNKCTVLAQVVTASGENKAWPARVASNNWSFDQGNKFLINKNTVNLATSTIFGGIIGPEGGAPSAWISRNLPLVNNYGGSYYQYFGGFPLSVKNAIDQSGNASGRKCFGGNNGGNNNVTSTCNTNTDCGANGRCMGIGLFCYSSAAGEINRRTNGQTCTTNRDCSEGYEYCLLPSQLPSGINNIPNAIRNLQGLFTKIYGIWEWTGQAYIDGTGNYAGEVLDVSEANGTRPAITHKTINPYPTLISAQGGIVKVAFNTTIDPDQIPIKTLTINWGDGQIDTLNRLNPRPNPEPPFVFHHSYSCLAAANGRSCFKCQGNGVLSGGVCTYNINGIVKDNWELENNDIDLNHGNLGTVTVGERQ